MMKKHIFILILLASSLSAQPLELPLFSTPNGVFIQIPGSEYAYQELVVERALPGRKQWKKIGKIGPPDMQQDLVASYATFQPYFPQRLSDPDSLLWEAWTYIRSRRPLDQQAFFRQPAVQLAMGFARLDETAESGKSYRYRLKLPADKSILAEGAIQFKPHQLAHPPLKSLSASRDEPFPKAAWLTQSGSGIADFLAFRRQANQEDFAQIWPQRQIGASQDSLRLILIDTACKAPGIYEYYIQPIDMLGNRGQASRIQRAGNLSRATLPIAYNFTAQTAEEQRAIHLTWKLSHTERMRSLRLYRSRHHARGFVRIAELLPTDTSYFDPIDEAREGYYYYLDINDLAGFPQRSATIFGVYEGRESVSAPADLVAKLTEKGVKLNWRPTGEFVRGYYIYRAEGYQGELHQISTFIPAHERPSFIDTTSLREGSVYSYAVRAESDTYAQSPFSKRAAVQISPAEAIAPPLNLRIRPHENGIRLVWDDLQARGVLVKAYQVLRKSENQTEFLPLSTQIPGTQNYQIDSTISPGKSYEYAVVAIDLWGGKSAPSRSVSYTSPTPTAITRLGLKRLPDAVELSWNYPKKEAIEGSFNLYRTTNGTRRLMIRLPLSARSFQDVRVVADRRYLYQLELVDASGNVLTESDPVPIRF